ncbi:MAG TPA: M1 family metallopeptidase [Bacteroidales bacterium]|nr:M1 family metallopeptidase [Bacteroidales bacterium]HPS16764.1 M1 family metallopeptidase [Bacteroidales bacterium]
MKKIIALCIMFGSLQIFSQNNSLYLPSVYKKAYEKGTRSYDGKPGSKYWSNRSEYNIKASLDPATKKLKGSEKLTYYNNSPDTISILIVKILQDIYKKESPRDLKITADQLSDGVNISSLNVNDVSWNLNDRKQAIRFGTNLAVRLQPGKYLLPGSSIKLNISWDYAIVSNGFRTGALTDSAMFIGYWYPQMAVYDDYAGWDTESYTGEQETYNDLANYKVELTLPSNYIVWATGDLLNASEIFNESIYKKIEASKKSKEVIKIITPEDYKQKITKGTGDIVWKYNAKNVPDFAWATSSYYLWDATTAVSDSKNNKTVWVNSIYPPTALQFKNVINYAKKSIEFLSDSFPGIPYPYDKHFTFNGHKQLAVEFPMMANNCDNANENYIYEITAHEIAHGYLPFYLMTNEREYAWMDEGFVKLFGEMALENKGVKRYENEYLNTIEIYKYLATSRFNVPLITPSSSLNSDYNFATSYAKSVNALYYLIQVMKEKGINNPLKLFMETWQDKHPTPYDFFFYMNTLAKEDLSWFWKPWYFEFTEPDISIKEVVQNPSNNSITIENTGGMPIPAVIKIMYADSTSETISKSALIWKNNKTYTFSIPGKKKIIRVELGDAYLVDANPENNLYKAK